MSQENVEIVRRGIEANHSDDLEARTGTLLGFWDENCEYTASTSAVDTEIYHGHGGIRRYLKHLADSWEEWRSEAEEVRLRRCAPCLRTPYSPLSASTLSAE